MPNYGDYPSLDGIKKILVIKLRQIGDVLLTTPVFHTLKKRFPNASIDAYVYRDSTPVLDHHPDIQDLLVYDQRGKKKAFLTRIKEELSLLKKIRKKRYDLVINLTEGDRGAIAARASKARLRIGFPPKGRWQKSLYTHMVKQCPSPRHSVEKNLDALRRIGISPDEDSKNPALFFPEEAKTWAEGFGKSFILIHPASRWRFKCLPSKTIRTVCEMLIESKEKILLTSGPDEWEILMNKRIGEGLDLIDLSGKTSIHQLAALIQNCKAMLSVDSLPFHIANALGVHIVAAFGPTSDIAWGPWKNPKAHVVTQNYPCRPCYMDGCGGSKISDCLQTIDPKVLVDALLQPKVLPQVSAFCQSIVH